MRAGCGSRSSLKSKVGSHLVSPGIRHHLTVNSAQADEEVTGGGTGLGLVTANALADNGCKVYITGRRPGPLEAAARSAGSKGNSGAIIPIVADVSTKEGIVGEYLYQRDGFESAVWKLTFQL